MATTVKEVTEKFISCATKEEAVAYMDSLVKQAIDEVPDMPKFFVKYTSVKLLGDGLTALVGIGEATQADSDRVLGYFDTDYVLG